MIQLAKKRKNLDRTKTRLDLWEEHLKDPFAALAKALECLEKPFQCWPLVRSFLLPVVVVAMASSIVGAKILRELLEGPCWEGVWPCLDPWDVVRLRTSSSHWNVPRKHWPHSELFFFRAEGSHENSAVQARCSCGNAQGVRADWCAPFGSRR